MYEHQVAELHTGSPRVSFSVSNSNLKAPVGVGSSSWYRMCFGEMLVWPKYAEETLKAQGLPSSLLFHCYPKEGKWFLNQETNWFSVLQLTFSVLSFEVPMCWFSLHYNKSFILRWLKNLQASFEVMLLLTDLQLSSSDCSVKYRLIQRLLGFCAFHSLHSGEQKKINCSSMGWSMQKNLIFSWF